MSWNESIATTVNNACRESHGKRLEEEDNERDCQEQAQQQRPVEEFRYQVVPIFNELDFSRRGEHDRIQCHKRNNEVEQER